LSMYKEPRIRTQLLSFLADKMKLEPLDVGAKMAELIQPGFLKPTIELLFPISGKLFEIGEISTLTPSGIGDFVWPSSARESFRQIRQIRFWCSDLKVFYTHKF